MPRVFPVTAARGALRVAIKLKPGASISRVEGVTHDAAGDCYLNVKVRAAPEKGKANAALITLLARAWRLPRRRLRISAGATHRRKTVRIEDADDQLLSQLTEWMASHDH